MNKPVNINEIENTILKNAFSIKSMQNAFKDFQWIDSWEKLKLDSESDAIPQKIFEHAPEKSIIAMPVPASTGYPDGNTAGFIYVITGKFSNGKAHPNLCFWINETTNDVYMASYNNDGNLFKWKKIYEIPKDYTSGTFGTTGYYKYRLINDRFAEIYISTGNETFSTQTDVVTLPGKYTPKSGTIVLPMQTWNNTSSTMENNAFRVTNGHQIQIIAKQKYLFGYIMYPVV